VEPKGSLPHSLVPATCPYPESARSSPYPHILRPEHPLIFVHSHIPCINVYYYVYVAMVKGNSTQEKMGTFVLHKLTQWLLQTLTHCYRRFGGTYCQYWFPDNAVRMFFLMVGAQYQVAKCHTLEDHIINL
jgi:hypothetical protein